MTYAIPVQCFTELWSHTLGARSTYWVHTFQRGVKLYEVYIAVSWRSRMAVMWTACCISSFVWLEGNLPRNILSGFYSATPLLYLCHILHGTHTRKIYIFIFIFAFSSYHYCALWENKRHLFKYKVFFTCHFSSVIKGRGCIQNSEKILSIKGNTIRLC